MIKKVLLCVVSIAILIFAAGCDVKSAPKEVTRIIYTIDSGAILPELQAHEVYTVTPGTVTLNRSGVNMNTQVFEGEWTFATDETLLKELFTIAESRPCSEYKRVEPADSPDGGETITITLTYADASECALTINPGVSYVGAEELLGKIREVLANMKTRPDTVPE